jgi:hypothetical protein
MALASGVIESITQRVVREYPEMRGSKPTITSEKTRYSLVFRGKVATPAGDLSRQVRVVVDENGHILRMSTTK